ncbi:MAG: hypothetical protein ABI647_24060 [Gemmatimonadota bacterium]
MRLNALLAAPRAWTAHGLTFSQHEMAGADVHVTFGEAPERLDEPCARTPQRDAGPGDWLVRLAPDRRLRATDGRMITIDAPPDANQADLARWIEGPATAAILYQRGILPLHASAVLMDGELVAFLAPSGTGKSSLAAGFVADGATLFADDLLAVRLDEDGAPKAFPGSTRLRIPAATWAALGSGAFRVLREDPDGKRVVLTGRPRANEPRPIAAIFLLEIGADLYASRLAGFALLRQLRHLVARPALARPLGAEAAVFAALGRITEVVPAWRLVRPEAGWSLGAAQSLIRGCLAAIPPAPVPESSVPVHEAPAHAV